MKFAKVMFLHVSVSHSVHRGVCLSACWDIPLGADPPLAHTASGTHTPPEQTPLEQTPPSAEHAQRYGQCTGGTHPTGMQSCYMLNFKEK